MPPFKPRDRKQRHRRHDRKVAATPADTNVAEIIPVSNSEKEAKRQQLRDQLREQQPKMSSKKKKRLDKYIETKLRKEEGLELMKKLAETKVDLSEFRSIKDSGKKERSHLGTTDTTQHASEAHLSGDDSDEFETGLGEKNATAPDLKKPAPQVKIGIGLKRPLELGEDGFPVLKRKRTRKIESAPKDLPWEGFDSSEDERESDNADLENLSVDSKEERSEVDSENESEDVLPSGRSSEDATSDESEDEDEDDDNDGKQTTLIRPRQSAFKSWATSRINESVGFKPSADQPLSEQFSLSAKLMVKEGKVPKNSMYEDYPLPQELQPTTRDPNRKAFSVQVDRPEGIQEARLKLPVVGEEQKIMEAIFNNSSIVIWGATGSGKTTQLPQFLFEAGFGHPDSPNPGMIAVTQPRRVAAVSMSKRVGDELGQYSDRVSYQIRFDTNVSSKTAIKFMTDGILLREIANDFSLSKYSVIIIDEAHERSVNTDILIGMASRIVDLRESMCKEDPSVKPLKLVIMSATLRISDFTQNIHLFRHGIPPLIQAEGRQYPVTVHFARRTHRDYVEEAFRKVSRGHRKLPAGAMLVFLTGQNEIKQLSKRLKQVFKPTQRGEDFQGKLRLSAADAPLETEDLELGDPDTGPQGEDDDSDIDIVGLDDEHEDDEDFDLGEESMSSSTRVHVLPLYSQLPTKEQLKVFEPPPEGSRLIVLATNVAETSLTIPGIKYVFDCGRSKEKQYDLTTGVQTFQIGWISKASASQRAGRAGRTGPGHCYRLYSSAIYEADFPDYTEPEILRTPIEGVVLQMKSMGLHNVTNFPFPTPPSRQGLTKAEKLLKNLGALKSDGQVTELGNKLSSYPLSPRYGKMLQIGHQHGCMPYVIAVVSALAVGDLFVQESQSDTMVSTLGNGKDGIYTNSDRLEDTAREKRRKDFYRAQRLLSKHDDTSDALRYLSAICAYAYASASDEESFCEKMFLRAKGLKEASQLRSQLADIVRTNNLGLLGSYESRLPEPTEKQIKALKQIVTAGFIDNVAIRADMSPEPPEMQRKPRGAVDVPYYTLFRSRESRATEVDEKAVYIHPSSILAHLTPKEMPQYIIYSHLQQSTPSHVTGSNVPKIRMFPLVAPSGLQLLALAHGTPLIEYGKPIGKVEALTSVPQRRQCFIVPLLVGEPGSTGWPLPAKKVVQVKDPKEGWIIERFLT
ncbi:putative DEAH-box RNA helicase [Talaromyces proteolyticus]|uniref:RNA helicase n=1 Tax=Talaromyces proteolyticus TaxID=1131652 RepID=A0AAD4PYW9_9EURO|nr:putative DEAH-box RNA helicase [Talaromyces proteolyticus]KAH8695084.1 putative DEAH-box RNA helicase [Talaromyces proteolyticus]